MATPAPKATGQPRPDAGVASPRTPSRTLRERDEEALELKRRFRAISSRIERRGMPQRLWRRYKTWLCAAAAAIVLCAGALYAWSVHTGWPVSTVLKHVASFPDCASAYSVGLAPARRGEPGYWWRHDADHDGIACEVPPRVRLIVPQTVGIR